MGERRREGERERERGRRGREEKEEGREGGERRREGEQLLFFLSFFLVGIVAGYYVTSAPPSRCQ